MTSMALTVLRTLRKENLLSNARDQGEEFRSGLRSLSEDYRALSEPRGKGLMLAVDLDQSLESGTVMGEGLENGLVMGVAGENALRFVPPLILDDNETREALNRLDDTLEAVTN